MNTRTLVACGMAAITSVLAAAVTPEVAELGFDSRWASPQGNGELKLPSWITGIKQQGGAFIDDPRCWQVAAAAPKGTGRIEIALDRSRIASGNLVVTLLFDADDNTDVAVQLFDSQGRVVVVDLFGNVVDIGKQATTDTFAIPLSKYPTADRIVIRRVEGGLNLHGIVLFPVVTEGPMEQAALKELARVLGDPLSPENPLVPSIQNIARSSQVNVSAVKPAVIVAGAEAKAYPAATPQTPGANAFNASLNKGLLAHLNFENNNAQDTSEHQSHGQPQAGASFVPTERGTSLRLRKNPTRNRGIPWDAVIIPKERMPKLHDQLSLCAWVRYESIAGTWGSQIIWHGDSRFGRDPWVLHLLPSGRAEFRSDRSVTGRPQFTVFEDEIQLSPTGKPTLSQHIAVQSPLKLERGQWYFLVGTMDKMNERTRTMRLYINGAGVSELQTTEVVNYDTDAMWTTIGAVDSGGWQNFDGHIDDVRLYDRALSPEEVLELYQQPWK
jgi:hypothetical protein